METAPASIKAPPSCLSLIHIWVLYFTDCALKISERPKTYICEEASWGGLPHDIRSIAFYNIGQYHEAVKEAEKALSFYPDNVRIKNNIDIIRNKIE